MLFKTLPIYVLVRIVALVLAILGFLFLLKKKKLQFVVTRIVVVAVAVLYTLGLFLPVENLFVTFETPEEAIEYFAGGTTIMVAEGEQSCCGVMLKDQSSYGDVIIPRSKDGYKLPYLWTNNTMIKFTRPMFTYVYHVSGTEDYYISAFVSWDDPVKTITDSTGYPVKYYSSRSGDYVPHTYTLLSYSNGYPEDYHLWINGEEVVSFE